MSRNNNMEKSYSASNLDTTSTHSVYIVEDHNGLRQHIVNYINNLPGLEVIGQAASAEAALGDPIHKEATIVITDMTMPGMNGIDLAHRLCVENPDYLIILLTAHDEMIFAERAFESGAAAYILKDNPFLIEEIIPRLLAGERDIVALG